MFDETDGLDIYLSRCLKNWAAQQQPPDAGRERLLAAAWNQPGSRSSRPTTARRAGSSLIDQVLLNDSLNSWKRRLDAIFIGYFRPPSRMRGELFWSPVIHTQLFSMHFSWGWRLAH